MNPKYKNSIYLEEYVQINGIDQYLFHAGTKSENPIMLFLHGGPGSVESLFAYTFQKKWEDIYTVIHWDQRGSGKTLLKNPDKDKYPTPDLLIKDLFEIIEYLKKKYNKKKIVLLGHSWGSVLGSIFIKKYPESIAYYIGVGQVVNMAENESIGYKKVKEAILNANDKNSLKKLNSIGIYPKETFDETFIKSCKKLRKLQGKYNLAVKIDLSIFTSAFKSPIFKSSDILALIKSLKSNESLIQFLFDFNLNLESIEYEVPIYYILGENDWQVPYTIAKEYFNKINAPHKDLYIIPNAGHMTMMDQPELFFNSLSEIYIKNNL
ncbi:alpha/beta hydrolase [Clostridium sp. SHJSY1]|uniref:alpha/beta fold hydrolase n=1 Tax=Clostridium sp. SHJSY1 TaxID=2942483 RepID=UPI0028742C04|nr:alpha/beta hydrolase [Clostridium sp. SHJSY1]MDS0526458.1 alpha/beta hydrolase [Clostridium sp. SHJSY1]